MTSAQAGRPFYFQLLPHDCFGNRTAAGGVDVRVELRRLEAHKPVRIIDIRHIHTPYIYMYICNIYTYIFTYIYMHDSFGNRTALGGVDLRVELRRLVAHKPVWIRYKLL